MTGGLVGLLALGGRRRRLVASLAVAGCAGMAAGPAAAGTISLSGNDGQGCLLLAGLNGENEEPRTPAGRDFDYPYYVGPSQPPNFWVLAVEPFTTGLTYPDPLHPTGPGTLESVTGFVDGINPDADFSSFDIGTVDYDDLLLTDPARFPLNEFPIEFTLDATSVSGTGLTFEDGTLTSIDFVADVTLGSLALGGSFSGPDYFGTLTFAGGAFAFDIDGIADVLPFAQNVRVFVNRSGTVAAVPEPQLAALVALAGFVGLTRAGRRRA